MYLFINDYSEGCHPKILEALTRTNTEQTAGYGCDDYCKEAAELILKELKSPESRIHFFVGGTQTNLTVIASVLRPHQGVIAAETGHINVHESGAIEACGHKVLTVKTADGKLTAEAAEKLIKAHYNDPTAEHMVQPGMIYISNPTELGTIYLKEEITALKTVADMYGTPLFLDGARLGTALTAACRSCALYRSVLHRRHKNGSSFRRSLGDKQDILTKGLSVYSKAKGRNACEGPAFRDSV